MRVPYNSSNAQFSRDTAVLKQKQLELAQQLSNGQRVQRFSDDAVAAGRASEASTEKSKVQAFARNVSRADTIGNFSLDSLQAFKDVSDSAYRIAITNDGLSNSSDLRSREGEMLQLLEQGLNVLNTKLGDDYLFAGANTSELPYEESRYTEFLEDEDGNFIDLGGNLLAPGDTPIGAVFRDTSGDIIFENVLSPSEDPIPEGTFVDPATGNQTDSSGNPLPGPVALNAGIDFNNGELVELDSETSTFVSVLDSDGNTIVPANPDPSGTGFITTTRDLPDRLIGEVYRVEYTGSVDRADDVRFRVSGSGQVSPFSRGAQNQNYAAILNNMIELRDAFQSEDLDDVSEKASALDGTRDEVIDGIVEIASKVNGLGSIERLNAIRFNELENIISTAVDADIAETIMALNQTQTAYEAALSSGARVMDLSLLDFLR